MTSRCQGKVVSLNYRCHIETPGVIKMIVLRSAESASKIEVCLSSLLSEKENCVREAIVPRRYLIMNYVSSYLFPIKLVKTNCAWWPRTGLVPGKQQRAKLRKVGFYCQPFLPQSKVGSHSYLLLPCCAWISQSRVKSIAKDTRLEILCLEALSSWRTTREGATTKGPLQLESWQNSREPHRPET